MSEAKCSRFKDLFVELALASPYTGAMNKLKDEGLKPRMPQMTQIQAEVL